MVRFGNLLILHHLRHRHQRRLRYSSWTLGKADCVLHPNSGWTQHFQAMLRLSPFASFLSPSMGRPLVSSFRCVCHPHFAQPNLQLMRTQLFTSMYVYHHLE
jgi:hypothetical protein